MDFKESKSTLECVSKDFLRNVDRENIIFIETENFFCNIFEKDKCNASTETQIFYTDTNHLTFEGALFLTDHLEKLIINKTVNN